MMEVAKNMFIRTVKNLFSVPKCIGCNECLSPIANEAKFHGNIVFCPTCEEKWNIARAQMCKGCGNNADKCTCFDSFFKKEQSTIPSLMFYRKNGDGIAESVILGLKRKKNMELFSYLSSELAELIRVEISERSISPSSCILTYVPRKRSSVKKYGFDQGRVLCELVAKELGTDMLPLFTRVGGKEQKKLTKAERSKNIKSSILLNKNLSGFPKKINVSDLSAAISGKTVIIIDDVMTSGVTLKHSVSLIRKYSTEQSIFVACVAKTATETAANVE